MSDSTLNPHSDPYIDGKAEVILYKGIAFRRYPSAMQWSDRMYYVPNAKHRRDGIGRLHQEVWKDAYGNIPIDHEIHHRDGNPLNNALDNLECISRQDHHALHVAAMPEWKRRFFGTHARKIRVKADSWHKSDAGREWHKAHGRQTWIGRASIIHVCTKCGVEFESLVTRENVLFCSNNCKAAARRESGVDNEDRICQLCGQSYTCNRYSPSKYCSRLCGRRSR